MGGVGVLRRLERGEAPAELIDALVGAAGLTGGWEIDAVPTSGWVNQTTVIRVGGERLVVRRYGWPFDAPEQFDRRAKEAWLLPHLAAAGVPAPEVLAVADAGDERGLLESWLPGELLGVVAAQHPEADLDEAWREAGAALARAHRIAPPEKVAGFVTDGGVAPFPEGSFGAFHRDRLERYSAAVAAQAPELGIDASPRRHAGGRGRAARRRHRPRDRSRRLEPVERAGGREGGAVAPVGLARLGVRLGR